MNAYGARGVSPAMPRDPARASESEVERMSVSWRAVVLAAPLPALPTTICALAELLNDDRHAIGIVRLQVLARVHPEMAEAIGAVLEVLLRDKVNTVRHALVK